MAAKTYRTLALVATLMTSPVVSAQDAEDEDELSLVYGDKATVSIATGARQSLRRAPAVATVITAEDIAAMGATDLDEILETVPGVHVARSPNNYSPLYIIRGVFSAYMPQVLMLQNGIPITTLYHGNKGNLWGGYPVEHIARIEVIRGPGSALYGADAYSGVINIITKTAADAPGTETGLRAGSFNTKNAWVQHGDKRGELEVAAYVRVGSTDGSKEKIDADAQTRLDRIFSTHASLAPGSINTGYDAVDANLDLGFQKWRFHAGYKLRDNLGTGAGIASALDPEGSQKSQRVTADLSWNDPNFARDWALGLTASFLHYTQSIPTDFLLFPAGANLGGGVSANGFVGGPDTWERQYRLALNTTYTGFAGHSLRLGLGHDDLNLYRTRETRNFTYSATGALIPNPGGAVVDYSDTQPFMFPQRRKVDYLYAQDEWNFAKDWTLTAGVRHDRYSDFGGTTNPRAALVWDVALDFTAKVMAGRAFRAPSFIEAYGITNPVALGNPNLKPETVNTVETAFSWQARRDTQVNLSLFHYNMKDIIRLVQDGVQKVYANTGEQTGRGAELEVVWDAGRNVRLSGNYAWQRSEDKATDEDAGYAPRHHIYARADWRFSGDWQTSAQVNRVAGRERAADDTRSDIDNYTTVDLTLRTVTSKKGWGFATSVRNLFDADVSEPSLAPGRSLPNDLPMPGRTVWIQASHTL